MKIIKLDFVDFWQGFNKYDNYFTNYLSQEFKIIISANPDYLFFSDYGDRHLKYKCIRIYYTGENLVPNFNVCDYAIGFHFISFGDRYARFPNYKRYESYKIAQKKHLSAGIDNKKKICNFVYSNSNANPLRDSFFKELSRVINIESGGKHLNNIGGPVSNKLKFQKDFLFSLAFENDSSAGYTTEKIIDAFAAETIPIYWGNPRIGEEFNESAFINLHSFDSTQEVIDHIKNILKDDKILMSYLESPIYNKTQIEVLKKKDDKFYEFLINIFAQEFETAKRRSIFAVSKNYQDRLLELSKIQNNLLWRIFKKLKGKLWKKY